MLTGITVESKLEAYELWNTLDYARTMYESVIVGIDETATSQVKELADAAFRRARVAARAQNELKEQFTLNVDDR